MTTFQLTFDRKLVKTFRDETWRDAMDALERTFCAGDLGTLLFFTRAGDGADVYRSDPDTWPRLGEPIEVWIGRRSGPFDLLGVLWDASDETESALAAEGPTYPGAEEVCLRYG